jgi:flagella basal body P-ring formation protein FlgA
MTFSKMILDLLNFLISLDNIHSKTNEKIKDLFKKLDNFKEINFLINRYIFKNKYCKTIF